MKINYVTIKDIILIVAMVILTFQIFSKNNEKQDIKPVTITIPEKVGTSGVQTIQTSVPTPIYIPEYKETIYVDKEYKDKYLKSTDSIEKLNMYLKSIKINSYEKNIIDNDTINISGNITTRGELLDYKIDYKIKKQTITYEPKIIKKIPDLAMTIGTEAGIPTVPNSNFILKANVDIVNSKGNGMSVGYDTDKRIWLGISKTITLKK